MSIDLSVGAVSVALNPDLYWTDENSWHPVEQSVTRSITGAQIISVAQRVGGRPITLQPENDASAWMTLAEINQVKVWAAIPGQQMTLTLRGVERAVVFSHPDPITAVPVVHFSDANAGDRFRASFKFLEI